MSKSTSASRKRKIRYETCENDLLNRTRVIKRNCPEDANHVASMHDMLGKLAKQNCCRKLIAIKIDSPFRGSFYQEKEENWRESMNPTIIMIGLIYKNEANHEPESLARESSCLTIKALHVWKTNVDEVYSDVRGDWTRKISQYNQIDDGSKEGMISDSGTDNLPVPFVSIWAEIIKVMDVCLRDVVHSLECTISCSKDPTIGYFTIAGMPLKKPDGTKGFLCPHCLAPGSGLLFRWKDAPFKEVKRQFEDGVANAEDYRASLWSESLSSGKPESGDD
jgi:hypothetical protein